MDDGSGKDNSDAPVGAPEVPEQQGQGADASVGQTRRTFSRSAMASSAVLLTLGNSSAWGQFGGWTPLGAEQNNTKKTEKVCVSTMILESFQVSSHFSKHAKDPDFQHYMSHVDLNGKPEPGYTKTIEGDLSCLTGPEHP